jgi:hypothetical protein
MSRSESALPQKASWYDMCYDKNYAACHVPWYSWDHCNDDYASGCSLNDGCWTDWT